MRIVSFTAASPHAVSVHGGHYKRPFGDTARFQTQPAAPVASRPQFGGLGEGKLLKAIRKGQTEEVKAMVQQNPALLHQEAGRWFFKTWPLIHAAWQDNLELVRFFLENGADPNVQKSSGESTALMQAVMNRSKPMAELLLSHGADPNLISNDYSAFMWAVLEGQSELVDLMLTKSRVPVKLDLQGSYSGKTALMLAAGRDHADLVYRFLKLGADPLLKDREGRTALMHARTTPGGQRRQYSASARFLEEAIGRKIRSYGDLPTAGKLDIHYFLAKLAGKDPWQETVERFDAMAPDKQAAFLTRLAELLEPEE